MHKSIYKYCGLNINSLKILINLKLYLGKPRNLNDVFEGEFEIEEFNELPDYAYLNKFYEGTKNKVAEVTLKKFRSDVKDSIRMKLQEEYGVSCFSTLNNHHLMWSHYADSLKGFCIQFNEDLLVEQLKSSYPQLNIFMEGIDYRNDYPKFKILIENSQLYIEDDDRIMYGSKHTLWEYEKERRLICQFPQYFKSRELSFEASCIEKIIIGEQMATDQQEFLCNLIRRNSHLQDVIIKLTEKDLGNNTIEEKKFSLIYPSFVFYVPDTSSGSS